MSLEKSNSRTFSGCWACRFKKRRCDERKPFCSLCMQHGDKCSYDVRLIWQHDNIFSVNSAKELVSWKKLKNLCKKPNRNRISKREFCQMTQFRQLSPPNSDDESVDRNEGFIVSENCQTGTCNDVVGNNENNEDKSTSFTISVRRLKIYDNVLECVHGKENKKYGQKYVNEQLSALLSKLEDDSLSPKKTHSGPFGVFKSCPCALPSSMNAKPDSAPLLRRKSDSVYSLPSSLPDTPISQSASARPSTTDVTIEFLACRWPNLLLANGSNFCLQQTAYVKWLTPRIRNMVHSLNPEFLEEVMQNNLQASKWLPIIPQFSMECQALYLLLIVMADTKQDYVDYISRWVQAQTKVSYLAFPLIAYSLNLNTNITFLIHCHELLSEAGLQDLYQYDLTSMLKINTVRLILQHWSNLMMDQICQCKDTTHAEMQLKFWELQLQCNEEFYRDICLA
ncbi:LANO_0F01750g1_1 [Lachancea nothofagi CBS 11611]|uniref:LANO_0F01750g1_1 n=1 Tax=Lachancea nothofagi CBS 11611 TaxID=1266666 RepID=A0A1G4K6C9_9SACH|nr:LANO_0F01750g1_1 [Lachancea nothofagi CBS 11611]